MFNNGRNSKGNHHLPPGTGTGSGPHHCCWRTPTYPPLRSHEESLRFGSFHFCWWLIISPIWGVPKMVGFPPKSSILIRISIINHPFWGTPTFGSTHILRAEKTVMNFHGFCLGSKGSCWWLSFNQILKNTLVKMGSSSTIFRGEHNKTYLKAPSWDIFRIKNMVSLQLTILVVFIWGEYCYKVGPYQF